MNFEFKLAFHDLCLYYNIDGGINGDFKNELYCLIDSRINCPKHFKDYVSKHCLSIACCYE